MTYDIHTRIEDVGFTTRTRNALRRAGIETVEQLYVWDDSSLSSIRNFGPYSFTEVRKRFPLIGALAPEYLALTSIFTSDEWHRLATQAEDLGFGDLRLSQLLPLVNVGRLRTP